MTSVLAIVSKKVFEEDARGPRGVLPGCGAVWATERYVSTHAGLRQLASSGSLFLVTVRPPDETLWLVAVLEEPTFDGKRWTAAPNVAPIVDLSAVIGRLRFANGKGLTVKEGRLGMALQTPRALSDDDVALLRAALAGTLDEAAGATSAAPAAPAPAPAPVPSPGGAPSGGAAVEEEAPTSAAGAARAAFAALVGIDEVEALDAALRDGRRAPARALKALKLRAKGLGATPAAAALLLAGAEGLLEAGKPPAAGELLQAWYAQARRAKPGLEPGWLEGLLLRFAAAGATPEKLLGSVAKDWAKRRGQPPAAAFLKVLGALVEAGQPLGAGVLPETRALLKAAGLGEDALDPLLTALLEHGQLRAQPAAELLADLRELLGPWLRRNPALHQLALWYFPQPWSPEVWGEALIEGRCLAALAPERAGEWCQVLMTWVGRFGIYTPEGLGWLNAALEALAPLLDGAPVPLEVGPVTDPEVLECVLAAGIELVAEGPLPSFQFYSWGQRGSGGPTRDLEHVAAHPVLSAALEAALARLLNDAHWQGQALAALEGARGLTPVLERLVAGLSALLRGGTLGDFEMNEQKLRALLSPGLLTRAPAAAALLEELDAALLLRNTLRLGVMDEYGWPAQEAAAAQIGEDIDQYDTDGNFPHLVMYQRATRRALVCDGTGVVYDGVQQVDEGVNPRSLRYANGRVCVLHSRGSLFVGVWSGEDRVHRAPYLPSWVRAVPTSDGGFSAGVSPWRGGQPLPLDEEYQVALFSDGRRCWRSLPKNRSEQRAPLEEFDPDTGRSIRDSAPVWFEVRDDPGGYIDIGLSALMPVLPGMEETPLGQREGLVGFRVRRSSRGDAICEGIDGRVWDGEVAGRIPHALMVWPERPGLYPVIYTDYDPAVYAPDGVHVVVPGTHASFARYWAGAPQWLPSWWWHMLRPRDVAGSAALREASLEAARLLVDAARADAAPGEESAGFSTGTHVVSFYPAPNKLDVHFPQAVAAVREVLPGVTAPRLIRGIARLGVIAARIEGELTTWRGAARATSNVEGVSASPLSDQRLAPLQRWMPHTLTRTNTAHIGRQIEETEHWFMRQDLDDEALAVGLPATETQLAWWVLLKDAGAAAWRMLGHSNPPEVRECIARLFEALQGTVFARTPERVRVIGFRWPIQPRWPVPIFGPSCVQGLFGFKGNRYLLHVQRWSGAEGAECVGVEYAPSGAFEAPFGGVITWEQRLGWLSEAALREALALHAAEQEGPVPDAAVARRISAETGLLYATATLLWDGAAGPWEPSREVRQRLGLRNADVAMAMREIGGGIDAVYAAAMPHPASALRRPLEPDASGRAPVERFIEAWVERFGVRTPLPVELIQRLESTFHASADPWERDVRVIEAPEAFAGLTQDARWVIRPWRGFRSNISYMRGVIPPGWPKTVDMGEEERYPDSRAGFTGAVLRRFLRYLPWAHLELPVGDVWRGRLAALAGLLRARLENPDLLLLAGAVDLSHEVDPAALEEAFAELIGRFEGAAYAPDVVGAAASGLDRGDLVVTWPRDVKNSIFIAFRPARLQEASALERMAADLGFKEVFQRTGGGCTCGLRFGQHDVVDFTDLREYMIWRAEGFQRLLGRLEAPGLPAGAFEADPAWSAPGAVEALRHSRGLDQDTARLVLQVWALAEPTEERLCRYNGWAAAELSAATAKALASGLLVEHRVDGAGRRLFASREVALLPTPAPPMERSKLELYGLEPNGRGRLAPPLGLVLPLRPLGEVFEAAARQLQA